MLHLCVENDALVTNGLNSSYSCEVFPTFVDGQIFTNTALIVSKISGKVSGMRPFGTVEGFFRSVENECLDLLVGMSNPVIFPVEVDRTHHAYMYKSLFGSEYFVSGTSFPTGNLENYTFPTMRTVLRAANNFLAVEAVGTNPAQTLQQM